MVTFFGIDWSRGGRSCDLLLLLLGLLEMVQSHPQISESGSWVGLMIEDLDYVSISGIKVSLAIAR